MRRGIALGIAALALTALAGCAARVRRQPDSTSSDRILDALQAAAVKTAEFSAQRERKDSARALAEQFGRSAIEPFAQAACGTDGRFGPRQLAEREAMAEIAAYGLAFIGSSDSVDALMKCSLAKDVQNREALLPAILDAPRAEARRCLEMIVATAEGTQPAPLGVQIVATLLLRVGGNKASLGLVSSVRDTLRRAGGHPLLPFLDICAANLKYKLHDLNAERRARYEELEGLFWLSQLRMPRTRNLGGGFWRVAEDIRARAENVPLDFLLRKLDATNATPEEIVTTACLCAVCRESRALPVLRKLTETTSSIPVGYRSVIGDAVGVLKGVLEKHG